MMSEEFADTEDAKPIASADWDTYSGWLKYHIKPKFPTLYRAVAAIVCATPTEAAVERTFSELKARVPRIRSRLSAESAQAIMIINSSQRLLRETEEDGAAPKSQSAGGPSSPSVDPPLGAVPQPRRERWGAPTSVAQKILASFLSGDADGNIASRLRPRKYLSQVCVECEDGKHKKLFAAHPVPKLVVLCSGPNCHKTRGANWKCAGFTLAQIPPAFETATNKTDTVPFHGKYLCPQCRATVEKRHRTEM